MKYYYYKIDFGACLCGYDETLYAVSKLKETDSALEEKIAIEIHPLESDTVCEVEQELLMDYDLDEMSEEEVDELYDEIDAEVYWHFEEITEEEFREEAYAQDILFDERGE